MKKLLCVLLTLCLLSALIPQAGAVDVVDASSRVKFGYIYNTPEDVIHDDAVYHKASEPDYTNTTWGSAVRACPEGIYDVIWMNTPDGMDDADVCCEYRINAPKAGSYEMVIIATGESEGYISDYTKPRGISWSMDGETRYNCDCFPILSQGYTYNNDPETGYAMGMIYSIVFDLSSGEHTVSIGNHTEYGKSGRMNFAGFYIQSYTGDNGRPAVTSKEDGETIEIVEREKYDTPYVAIDINNAFSNAKGLTAEKTDSGSLMLTCTETSPFDPSIMIDLSLLEKVVPTESYPYFALYMKTNSPDSSGEMFFSTSDSPVISAGQSVVYDYTDIEGGQIVVLDMTESSLWTGNVNSLRFDVFISESDYVDDVTEMTAEVFAAAFFKTEEDAAAFAVEGVNVDIQTEEITTAPEQTEAPATTEASSTEADSTSLTEAADTSKTATESEQQGTEKGNKTGIIIGVIAAVVVVAVVVVVIIVIKKKK